MDLSIRQKEVLEAIGRCEAVGFDTLALHFEKRFAADELRIVVDSLKRQQLVVVMPARRSDTVALTQHGRLELWRERRARKDS